MAIVVEYEYEVTGTTCEGRTVAEKGKGSLQYGAEESSTNDEELLFSRIFEAVTKRYHACEAGEREGTGEFSEPGICLRMCVSR